MRLTSFLRSPATALLLARLTVSFFPSALPVWAWDEHHLVTRESLSNLTDLRSQTVRYTSVDRLVKEIGFPSIREFNESIQIQKEYSFPPKLGETDLYLSATSAFSSHIRYPVRQTRRPW